GSSEQIPNKFTNRDGGGLSNPVFMKHPNGSEWKVYWTKHNGEVWLERIGRNLLKSIYSLDQGHLVFFKYERRLKVLIRNLALLCHPFVGQAQKHFGRLHPVFSKDLRNVRLGLCADDFNLFGQYRKSPLNPKHKIDIYLQPLIDELCMLWNDDILTYDMLLRQFYDENCFDVDN
ncbi:hypothetical protein CR513_47364, partial [Mucuna pruriens]